MMPPGRTSRTTLTPEYFETSDGHGAAAPRERDTDFLQRPLIRLVLRPLARTMTDPEANRIRDDVYLALHEGPVRELSAG